MEANSATAPQTPTSAKEIETWLVEHLAAALSIDIDEIDPEEPFAYYGLDSSVAVSLTGDLSEWMGRDLEPTLLWEYPDISTLTAFLASESAVAVDA